jgi:streptogramin lyase
MGGNVTKLSSSGTLIGTYGAGSHPEGVAIDPGGNVWVVNKGNGTPGTAPGDSNVTKLSSSGTLIGTYVAGSLPEIVAVDSAGNVWMTNGYGQGTSSKRDSVMELNPSGTLIGTHDTGSQPYGLAIDKSGNVWVTNYGNGTPGTGFMNSNVQEYMGAAKGPQYFPYSGPQWPGAE